MNGWILFYKKIWDNPLIHGNPYALAVWVWLLTHCDDNGEVTCGRYQIAKDTGVKPDTVYYWLKRFLNENQQLTNIETNNKYSKYLIVKFKDMQRKYNSTSQQKPTENQQPTNTNKQQRTKNKHNTLVETQSVYDLYIEKFNKNKNTYKLTDKRKLKIKARINDAGKEMLTKAIINVSQSSFHRGDNDRGWEADLDYIVRSYEQVEKLSQLDVKQEAGTSDLMKSIIGG